MKPLVGKRPSMVRLFVIDYLCHLKFFLFFFYSGHLPLICNMDGSKISKRQGDIDVLSYRDRGYFADTLLVYLSSIGGGFGGDIHDANTFFPADRKQLVLSKLVELFDESKISNKSVKLNQELLGLFIYFLIGLFSLKFQSLHLFFELTIQIG